MHAINTQKVVAPHQITTQYAEFRPLSGQKIKWSPYLQDYFIFPEKINPVEPLKILLYLKYLCHSLSKPPGLTLVPFTKIICRETLNNSTLTLTSLGIKPCIGWPDLETLDAIPRIINNLNKVKEPSGFESWMIIERDTN